MTNTSCRECNDTGRILLLHSYVACDCVVVKDIAPTTQSGLAVEGVDKKAAIAARITRIRRFVWSPDGTLIGDHT